MANRMLSAIQCRRNMETLRLLKSTLSNPVILWVTPDWWKFLLEKSTGRDWYCGRFKRMLCRASGHPAGVVFYRSSGDEPDGHCKCCGDDLA